MGLFEIYRDDFFTKDTCCGTMLIHYFTSEIETTPLQGTKLLAPKCPLFRGSTGSVYTITRQSFTLTSITNEFRVNWCIRNSVSH